MKVSEKAHIFALAAHAAIDQRRKYTGEPYITHCEAVASIVASVDHDDEMLAIAYLHDVLEDTLVTKELLWRCFGGRIAMFVNQLTKRRTNKDRAFAAKVERERLSWTIGSVQTIKVADVIDNTATIAERDPDFAKVYLEEKAALLDALTEADPNLLARARAQIASARESLNA